MCGVILIQRACQRIRDVSCLDWERRPRPSTARSCRCAGGLRSALIITKKSVAAPAARTTILEAGHPIPDTRSLAAGTAALEFASQLKSDDLLVCLISGGGSALASALVDGVSLGEVQALTEAALSSGADIEEINNLRRCLDRLKGGGLASATESQVQGLILSDVVGDRLDAIASGPTVPCESDRIRAAELLKRLVKSPPRSVVEALAAPTTRARQETPDQNQERHHRQCKICSQGGMHAGTP